MDPGYMVVVAAGMVGWRHSLAGSSESISVNAVALMRYRRPKGALKQG